MKKKPYNDNLVMASIESLYNQATDTPLPADAGIRRRDTGKLPILGSLPVSVSVDAADKGGDHLEDMVLTGLLDAVSGEPPVPVAAGPAAAVAGPGEASLRPRAPGCAAPGSRAARVRSGGPAAVASASVVCARRGAAARRSARAARPCSAPPRGCLHGSVART